MNLQRAVARAFRLRIEPDEVTASERAELNAAGVTNPLFMAFLAWRRAVLLLVAIALVPLTLLRFVEAFRGTEAELRVFILIPAIAEGFLCAVCWMQLFKWTRWAQQRRMLFITWLVFMAAPFVVFLIPAEMIGKPRIDATPLKITIAISALITLAPKAVSLLAGTLRAGIVTKMLFAGSGGPGWVVVLAAPLYTLLVFTLLIVPYQITGSGWYFAAMLALVGAQIALGRVGYQLTKPMGHADAIELVTRARVTYVFAMALFAVCLVIALSSIVSRIGAVSIINIVLSFETNVLILTLIGADLLIVNLDRARTHARDTSGLTDDSARQLEAFTRDA